MSDNSDKNILSLSVEDFLSRSASSDPTPGGGSIAAMQGCLGAAMVAMVANLTISNRKYEQYKEQAKAIRDQAQQLLEQLQRLIDEDIAIFNQFMSVFRMPKDTDEQKNIREQYRQKITIQAAQTPLEIAEKSVAVLELAEQLAAFGNKSAISDCGVGAYALEAAVKSALLSVSINIPGITDSDYIARLQEASQRLSVQAEQLREKTVAETERRIGVK